MAIDADEHRFDVVVARRVKRPTSWAPLGRRAEKFVGALPAHRDTRSGRRNANQVRMVMLAVGILVVVLWDSPWAPLAVLLCLVALVLPMSEARRRHWVATLRASRTEHVTTREPAELIVGPKHVTLTAGSEDLRRLRRKVLQIAKHDGWIEVKSGGKKRERFVLAESDQLGEELWVETQAAEEIAGRASESL